LSLDVFKLKSEFQCGGKVAAQIYDCAAVALGKYPGLQELLNM
jgi:hypothetical protein